MRLTPLYSRSTRSAFSLIELVIVMFLTSIILLAVSSLTSRTFQTLKFLQEKSQTLEGATLGCERLASELREAIAITDLSSGTVEFQKVRPNAPVAVGNNEDDVGPAVNSWERSYASVVGGANELMTVRFHVDGDQHLQRTAGGITTLVASEVNAFTVTPFAGATGCFTLSLSIQEERRVIVFQTVVTCPALQPGFPP